MKQVQVSQDVVFDESVSWYSLPSPTTEDSEPITGDEVTKASSIGEGEESRLLDSLIFV